MKLSRRGLFGLLAKGSAGAVAAAAGLGTARADAAPVLSGDLDANYAPISNGVNSWTGGGSHTHSYTLTGEALPTHTHTLIV
jgi:hypothetical protein